MRGCLTGAMATIKDVARKAGVSTATVSHVLNGTRSVRLETRDAVLQAMADLDYMPSAYARALRTRSSRQIGYVVADLINPFFASIFSGVEKVALKRGYTVVVSHSGEDAQLELDVINGLVAHGVDGLIVAPVGSSQLCTASREIVIPMVFIDRTCAGSLVPAVTTIMTEAIAQAVNTIHSRGFYEVALIAGRAGLSTTDHRVEAYLKAVHARGLSPRIYAGNSDVDSGQSAAKWAMSFDKPVGVVCGNNLMATGFVQTLLEAQKLQDFAMGLVVIGDDQWTNFTTPPLSIISQPTVDLGAMGANMLIDQIENSEQHVESVQLPCQFHPREALATDGDWREQ